MVGLTGLRGTWVALVVGATTFLVAQAVIAAPHYPVNQADAEASAYAATYDPGTHVLEISVVDGTAGDATDTTPPSIAVDGPNGQVNHGQVVRNVHDLVDAEDRGCVISAIARSDLGKGSQQVTTPEANTTASTDDTAEALEEIVLDIDCTNDKGAKGSAPSGADNGKPEKPGADNGKSAEAPGKGK